MILPDLPELLALRGQVQGLDLHAHRPALARLYGSHRSAQRGRGLEFEEVRPYSPGDDVRNIDWRVTARRGRPHTKLFREERERPVWLVADLHPGLFFGSRRQLKSALLLRAAAMLAWAAVQGGDRVGAVVGDGRSDPLIFPPRAREAGLLTVLQALEQAQPRQPARSRGNSLEAVLDLLQPVLQPGSLVLVLSDFSQLDDDGEARLAAMARRCDCRLLWITDPLEESGLPAGSFRVGMPGRLWWLDGKGSREAWQGLWQERRQQLEGLAQRLSLPLTRLDTAQPVTEIVPALLREPVWAA